MISNFFIILVGIISASLYEYIAVTVLKRKSLIIKGYRLHHSLFAFVFLFFALLTGQISFLLFGVGVLIQHTATDGFRFITKE